MQPESTRDPYREKRRKLIRTLREKGISSNAVLDAMDLVPRELFLPKDLKERAYEDRAFPIGEKQTISQPYTVAYQTQLLDLERHHRVLEIGTGSGYQAAILSLLAGEVFSIERQRRLFEKNRNFAYLRNCENLFLYYGDGFEGLPDHAPFDRILITAAAPLVPPLLVDQLQMGGKMVLPLGLEKPQRMVRLTKEEKDRIKEESFDQFSFVPLLRGRKE